MDSLTLAVIICTFYYISRLSGAGQLKSNDDDDTYTLQWGKRGACVAKKPKVALETNGYY